MADVILSVNGIQADDTGAMTVPQFLHGAGVPSSGLGNNGDTYLDDTSSVGQTYAKSGGAWTAKGTFQGPPGIGTTGQLVGINEQTGTSYTLALSDQGKDVHCTNAATITLTIPLNSAVAFPVGALVYFSQGGAGIVTASAAAGVTLKPSGTIATGYVEDMRALIKIATDTWRAV